MTKRVAVILSGCGVYDGAEIHESVLTLLRLDQRGAKISIFAPNITQHHVINHLDGSESTEIRNVLAESARIARGSIQDLVQLQAEDFDAVIVPGGFGVAKNLSDFAFKGAESQVLPQLLNCLKGFATQGKPIGLMCIAPTLAVAIYGPGVHCTIGSDPGTAEQLIKQGAEHQHASATEIIEDTQRKLVTTPAYMLAQSISEAAVGINKLVDRILELA